MIKKVTGSSLEITKGFSIEFSDRRKPNFWWRFWQWLLFGFKWKNKDRFLEIEVMAHEIEDPKKLK